MPGLDPHQGAEWNSYGPQGGSFNPVAEDFSRPPSDYVPPSHRRISDEFGVDRLLLEEMRSDLSSPVAHTGHTGFENRRGSIDFPRGTAVSFPSNAELNTPPDNYPREGRRESYPGGERGKGRGRKESGNSSRAWTQNRKTSNYPESRFSSAVRDDGSCSSAGSRYDRGRDQHRRRSNDEQRRGGWNAKPQPGRQKSRDDSTDMIRNPRREVSSDSIGKRVSKGHQHEVASSKIKSEWQERRREKRTEGREKFLGAPGVSAPLARRPLREHGSSPDISSVSMVGPTPGPVPIQERLGPQVPGMGSVQNRLGPPKESVHSRLGPEDRLGPPPPPEGVHSRLGPEVSSPSPHVKIEPPSLSPKTTLTPSVLTEPPPLSTTISVNLEGGRDPEMKPDLREELQGRRHSRMAPEFNLPSSGITSSPPVFHRSSPSPPASQSDLSSADYLTHQAHLPSSFLPSSSSSSLTEPHPMETALTSAEMPPTVSLSQGEYIDQRTPALTFASNDMNDYDHSLRVDTGRPLDQLPAHLRSHPSSHPMERVEAEDRSLTAPPILYPNHESQVTPSLPPIQSGKDTTISSPSPSRAPPTSAHKIVPPHSSSTHHPRFPRDSNSISSDAVHSKPPSLPQDVSREKSLDTGSQHSTRQQAPRRPVLDKKKPSSARVGERKLSQDNDRVKSGPSSRDVCTSTPAHSLSKQQKPPFPASKSQSQKVSPSEKTQPHDSPIIAGIPPGSSPAMSSFHVEVKHRKSSGMELNPMECGYSKGGVASAAVVADSEVEEGEITDTDSEPGLVIDLEHSFSSSPKSKASASENPTASGSPAREKMSQTELVPCGKTPTTSTSKVSATGARYGSQSVSSPVEEKASGKSYTPLQDPRTRHAPGKGAGALSAAKALGETSVKSRQASSQTAQTGQSSSISAASQESGLHARGQAPKRSTIDEGRRKEVAESNIRKTKLYRLACTVLCPPVVEALITVKCEGMTHPVMCALRNLSAQLHRVLCQLFQEKNLMTFNVDAAMSYIQTRLPKSAVGDASIGKLGRLVVADSNTFFLYELHVLSKDLGNDTEKWKSYIQRYNHEMREMLSFSSLKKRFPYDKKEIRQSPSSQVIMARQQFQRAMGRRPITYRMLDEEEKIRQPTFLQAATLKYGLPLTHLLKKASLVGTSKKNSNTPNKPIATGSMQPEVSARSASPQSGEVKAEQRRVSLVKQASTVLSSNLAESLSTCMVESLEENVLQCLFSNTLRLHRLLHVLFNRKRESGVNTDVAVCYIQTRLSGSTFASASVTKVGKLLAVHISHLFRHELHFLRESFKDDIEKWRDFVLKYHQEMKELTHDSLKKKFPKEGGVGMNLHSQVTAEQQKASHQKVALYDVKGAPPQPTFLETAKQMFGGRLTKLLQDDLPPCSSAMPMDCSATPTPTSPPADSSAPTPVRGSKPMTKSAKAVSPSQPAVPIPSPSPVPIPSPVLSSIPPLFPPGSSTGCVAMPTAHTTIPPLFPTTSLVTTVATLQSSPLPFSSPSPPLATLQEDTPKKASTTPLTSPPPQLSTDVPPTSIPPLFPSQETSSSVPPLSPPSERIPPCTSSTSTTDQLKTIPSLFPSSPQSQTPGSSQSKKLPPGYATTSQPQTIPSLFPVPNQPRTMSTPDEGCKSDAMARQSEAIPSLFTQSQTATPPPCQSNVGIPPGDASANEMDSPARLNSNEPIPFPDGFGPVVEQSSADKPMSEVGKSAQSPAQESQAGMKTDSEIALVKVSVSPAEGSGKQSDGIQPSMPDHPSSPAEKDKLDTSTSDGPAEIGIRERRKEEEEEGGVEGGGRQKIASSEGGEVEQVASNSDKMSISSGEIISPTPSPPSYHGNIVSPSNLATREKTAEVSPSHHHPAPFGHHRVGSEEPRPFWSARSHSLSEQSDWRIRTESRAPPRRESLPRTRDYRWSGSPSSRSGWREREMERGGGRRDGGSRGRSGFAERHRRFRSRSRSISPVLGRNSFGSRRRHHSHSPDGHSARFGLRPHQYLSRRSWERREGRGGGGGGGGGGGRGGKERERIRSKEERRRKEPGALDSDEDLEVLELRKEAIMSMLKDNEEGEKKQDEKERVERGGEGQKKEGEGGGGVKEAKSAEQGERVEDVKAGPEEVAIETELRQEVKASENESREREEAKEGSEVSSQPTAAMNETVLPRDDGIPDKPEVVLSPSSTASPPVEKASTCALSPSPSPLPPSLPHIPTPPPEAKASPLPSTSTKPSKPPATSSKTLVKSLSASLSVPSSSSSSPKTGSIARAVAISLLKPGSPKPASLPSSRGSSRKGSPASSLGSPAQPPGVESGLGRSGTEMGDLSRRGSTASHKPTPSVKVRDIHYIHGIYNHMYSICTVGCTCTCDVCVYCIVHEHIHVHFSATFASLGTAQQQGDMGDSCEYWCITDPDSLTYM